MTATLPPDRRRVVALLEALGAIGEATVLTIKGQPLPKPRPRFGQGRAFASDRQLDAEGAIAAALWPAFPRPLRGNVAIAAIFFRRDRKVVDRDNLDKLVGDAANGIVVTDDCQVTAGAQLVELDRRRPRTVLGIARHESSLAR